MKVLTKDAMGCIMGNVGYSVFEHDPSQKLNTKWFLQFCIVSPTTLNNQITHLNN